MLVDLSHTSPDTMADAIRVSDAPVIFSHSAAKALNPVPRNVPDDILKMLPKNGGIVMVTFVPSFLSAKVADWTAMQASEESRLKLQYPGDQAAVKKGLAEWTAAYPATRASIQDAADHIDHIRSVAGIDHIGLGGDFDGITAVVEGLEDVSTYPALTAELLRRGYKDADVLKITGQNVLRVMRSVEDVSKTLQSRRAASAAIFER
jgi:membrane dipeptidase